MGSRSGWVPTFAILVIAALAPTRVRAQTERVPDSLVFATGRETGNYYALARELVARADRWCPGCRIEVKATSGSYDNASLLREGDADLALIQSDVAYLEHFEERPFLAIAAPYIEPVHIVARRELGLEHLSELATSERRFRVAIGPVGSGSASHAMTVLEELESEGARFDSVQGPLADGFELLRRREVDVAFVTSAVPVESVRALADQGAVSLLDIDADLARRLKLKNPFFCFAEIPYQAYGGMRQTVATLGTRTLLVVRKGFRPSRIEPLLDTLYALGGQRPALPFLRGLSAEAGLGDLSIPARPEALAYHRRHENRLHRLARESRGYLLPVTVLLMPLLVLLFLPRVAFFIHQFVLGRVLVLLTTIWLVGSAAMYLLEGQKNSSFRSFGNSAVAILYYLFSGFETKYPMTVPGNVVAVLILSLGVGVVTLFTATLVTLLVEKALHVRRIRPKPHFRFGLRKHVVFVGWSERAERVLQYLRNREVRPRPIVAVAADKPPRPKQLSGRSLRGVWSAVRPREGQALRLADASNARVALVLGRESRPRADWRVASSALAVARIAPAVHTVVGVARSESREHLEGARPDEVVVTETLGERLISQCAITPGISAVYNELLTFGTGSQEIYLGPVPRQLSGLSFHQVRRGLIREDLIPIGCRSRERGEVRINPRGEEGRLQTAGKGGRGDTLAFVADNGRALPRSRFWKPQPVEGGHRSPKGGIMPGRQEESRERGSTPETKIGICGWSAETRAVVEQLRESVITAHHRFSVTVISEPEETGFSSEANGNLHDHVRFVIGDPTRRLVLKNAGVEEFRSLVILADRRSEAATSYSDHRALMIAIAASTLNPSLHVIAELLDAENREHFEQLASVEVVSVEELAEKLLAQAVVNPGITEVYRELLTATEDSNEIYIVEVPEPWVGQTFGTVYSDLLEGEQAVLPIGYRVPASADHGPMVVLNPSKKARTQGGVDNRWDHPLDGKDSLVLIAYEEPDLADLATRSHTHPEPGRN